MLILIKWIQGSKPDLYHVMIYMFLSPGEDLGENQLFWGQSYFQVHLPDFWLDFDYTKHLKTISIIDPH